MSNILQTISRINTTLWFFRHSTLAALAVGSLLVSCTGDYQESLIKEKDLLNLEMTRTSPAIRTNAKVYVFKGTGATRGYFNHRVGSVSTANSDLTMIMPTGTWDMVLVSSETGATLIDPLPNVERSQLKMWQTVPVGGVLPSMPELFTSAINGQVIVANTNHTTSTSMARNVAMIKVVIKEAKGFKTTGSHSISLTNVPTSLTWTSGLYPSKSAPDVSASPMKGNVMISNGVGDNQVSDTAYFCVPAHMGIDFLSDNPTDTTTSKLKIAVDLVRADGSFYSKANVVLPTVPKANKVLLVNLHVSGSLTVTTTTHDWTEHNLSADISQTLLQVSKPNVALSSRDTVYVKTNYTSFTATSGDPTWLTVNVLDAERVEFVASTATYTAPRTSYVDIKSGNVTKRISVRQRPEVGTITATPPTIWVSPSSGNTSRTIAIKSSTPWTVVGTPLTVTPGATSGAAGTSNVIFTRKFDAVDMGNYDKYGRELITLRNTQTLENITVTSDNLYMRCDDIYLAPNRGNPATHVDTTIVTNNVEVYGLSRRFTVVSKPAWITAAVWVEGTGLRLTAQREPNDDEREGNIVFAHADDPTYQITAKVKQEVLVTIPAFQYFVLKFTWESADIDISVGFRNNGAPAIDDLMVGWNQPYSTSYNGEILLQFGGDATGGQGETVFFNAPVIDASTTLPRKVTIEAYASWHSQTVTYANWCTVTMYAYLGGTMLPSGTNFNNSGGTLLYSQGSKRLAQGKNGGSSYLYYTHICDIVYDRVKHSASITWFAPLVPVGSTPTPYIQQTPQEAAAAAAAKEAELRNIKLKR